MMRWFLILAILPLVSCNQPSVTISVDRVIHTLTRALLFFSRHANQVNLDAGIGTRMAADQLRTYTTCKRCQSVKKLVDLSESVTWQIIRSVRHRQPEYYDQLSFFLAPGIFSTSVPFQLRKSEHRIPLGHDCSGSSFVEKYSDQCLHGLAYNECQKSEACMKVMNDTNACHYSLTHQILYSILAKKFSCQSLSSKDEHRMVLRMLNESQLIAEKHFPETDRDLFMEQIAFGGLLGWSDFFEDNHSLESIISWQHPLEGCYGNDTNQFHKREEMQMAHQCLSHRTSVAIAALSQLLRHLLSRDI